MTRLSNTVSSLRCWFCTTSRQVQKYQQAMAECRRLKGLLATCQEQHKSDVAGWNANSDEMLAESRKLMQIIAEQDQQQKASDWQIKRLEAELEVAKTTIERIAAERTCEMTQLQMMTATHIAVMTKATSGHPQNGIGELL